MSASPRSAPWALALPLAPVAAVVVVAWWIGADLWFFSDDWNIFADFHAPDALLDPFNGHLSLVPVAAYQTWFRTLGVDEYWPYRLVGITGYAALGYQVVAFARARIGAAGAGVAVTLVVWSSAASTTVMFPFLVNYSLPIAAMVAIWRRLDRDDLRADVGASVWLTVALATSGLGVMTALATATELAWRRAPLRRWATFAPGVVAWTVWYLFHRGANDISGDLGRSIRYAGRMLAGGARALAAGWGPGGVLVALAVAAVVAAALLRWRSIGPHAAGGAVALGGFVASTALTRLDVVPAIPPDEIRYRWAVATYVVLLLVALAPRRPLPTARPAVRVGLGVVGAVAVAGAVVGIDGMVEWTDTSVAGQPGLRAVVAAVEIVGDDGDPSVVIPLSYVPVTAGAYLEAVEDVGSPIAGVPLDVEGAFADQTAFADRYLVEQASLAFTGAPPAPDTCSPLAPGGPIPPGATVSAGASPGGAAVSIWRFGEPADAPTLVVPPGGGTMTLPDDPDGLEAGRLPYRGRAPDGVELSVCDGP